MKQVTAFMNGSLNHLLSQFKNADLFTNKTPVFVTRVMQWFCCIFFWTGNIDNTVPKK